MEIQTYFETENGKIIHGDCRIVVNRYPENHFGTIITDPPYGLRFMNKKWDYDIPSVDTFKKLLRVAKPGATLLCFAGTRTQHRMGVNIEDAGWILKDTIMWFYGSGFPKAADISKQIDTKACREQLTEKLGRDPTKDEFKGAWNKFREISGKREHPTLKNIPAIKSNAFHVETLDSDENMESWNITAPATEKAKQFEGYKSHNIKPAYEPIIMAMKPNEGSYADNALKHGVSGLNIDACRIKHGESVKTAKRSGRENASVMSDETCGFDNTKNEMASAAPAGRFPSNIILTHHPECECIGTKKIKVPRHRDGYLIEKENFGGTRTKEPLGKNDHSDIDGTETVESWNCHEDCPVGILDEQSGERKAGGKVLGTEPSKTGQNEIYGMWDRIENSPFDDTGTASRFFYCAKASRSERGEGNNHPTVKPKKLIEYLIKLATPPGGGIILDPYFGSGTLGVAIEELNITRNKSNQIKYVAIENEIESCQIAKRRIEKARFQQQRKLF